MKLPWYLDLRLINCQINNKDVCVLSSVKENSHGLPQELSIAIAMETTLAQAT